MKGDRSDMAEYGEWNRKGAVLSDVTAQKEYGVTRDFISRLSVMQQIPVTLHRHKF